MGWSCGRTTISQVCFSVSAVNSLNYFELPKNKNTRSERSKPLSNDPCSITAKHAQKKSTESFPRFNYSALKSYPLIMILILKNYPSRKLNIYCSTSWISYFQKRNDCQLENEESFTSFTPTDPVSPHLLWRFHLLKVGDGHQPKSRGSKDSLKVGWPFLI